MNDIHCKLAMDMGVMVAISTDSHNRLHMENMKFGVYTARRGWLEKEDVLNTRTLNDVIKILKIRRSIYFWQINWCRRGDSNPYRIAPTRP